MVKVFGELYKKKWEKAEEYDQSEDIFNPYVSLIEWDNSPIELDDFLGDYADD